MVKGIAALAMLLALVGTVFAATYSGTAKPSASTLAVRGGKQTGGIGSYSWSDQRRFWFDAGAAVDAIGIPVPDTALTVPAGERLTFSYHGQTAPSGLDAHAYPLKGELHRVAGYRWLEYIPEVPDLPVTMRDRAAEIVAPLTPGAYVIAVDIQIPEIGSATYGFHVIVP